MRRSSGHFIYANTVVRYVTSSRHNPIDRLKAILGLRRDNRDQPFSQLDALYHTILSNVVNIEATMKILGVNVVQNDVANIEQLEEFMILESSTVDLHLIDLRSVVDASDSKGPIKYLHASFRDFLLDATRSGNLFIDINAMSIEAIILCIKHINLFWDAGKSLA